MTAAAGITHSADEIVATLDRDGYAVIEGVIDRDAAAEKRAELAEIFATTPSGRDDFEGHLTRRIYALFAKTRTLDELATHPLDPRRSSIACSSTTS